MNNSRKLAVQLYYFEKVCNYIKDNYETEWFKHSLFYDNARIDIQRNIFPETLKMPYFEDYCVNVFVKINDSVYHNKYMCEWKIKFGEGDIVIINKKPSFYKIRNFEYYLTQPPKPANPYFKNA